MCVRVCVHIIYLCECGDEGRVTTKIIILNIAGSVEHTYIYTV